MRAIEESRAIRRRAGLHDLSFTRLFHHSVVAAQRIDGLIPGDGIPDLSFTVNNGSVSTFLNTSRKKFVGVRIKGKKGNLRAVGANLTFATKNGTTQTIEITGGGSYLSQSGNTKFFGLGDDLSGQLSVVWPDGKKFILNDVKQGLVDLMWN